MTTTLSAITVDCADAARVAAFWAAALGQTVDDGATDEFASIRAGEGSATAVPWMFVQVPESKQAKNRLHLDLTASEPSEVIEGLVALGATRLGDFDEDGTQWTTLADPEGNELDILHGAP